MHVGIISAVRRKNVNKITRSEEKNLELMINVRISLAVFICISFAISFLIENIMSLVDQCHCVMHQTSARGGRGLPYNKRIICGMLYDRPSALYPNVCSSARVCSSSSDSTRRECCN